MEIHPSARRHGITDDDILHAIEQPMVVDDTRRGPGSVARHRSRSCRANLLELVALITEEGELIVHAIPLRALYRKLLDP